MFGRIVANLYGKHRGLTRKVPEPPPKAVPLPGHTFENPLEGKSIPYRLQVETTMSRKDLPALARGGRLLVALIESTQVMKLLHASMSVNNGDVRIYHYWNLNYDADNLTRAELRLPDLPGYAQFERLIVDEVKDIVVPTARVRREPPKDLAGPYVYVRVTNQVRSENLAEFQARLEASVIPFAVHNGWYLGDSFLGITGLAGKIIQLWIVPENAVALAETRLSTAPWQDLLRDAPTYQYLQPLPVDPFLGEIPADARKAAREAAKAEKKKSESLVSSSYSTTPQTAGDRHGE